MIAAHKQIVEKSNYLFPPFKFSHFPSSHKRKKNMKIRQISYFCKWCCKYINIKVRIKELESILDVSEKQREFSFSCSTEKKSFPQLIFQPSSTPQQHTKKFALKTDYPNEKGNCSWVSLPHKSGKSAKELSVDVSFFSSRSLLVFKSI